MTYFFKGIPVWVFVLLIFLLFRGISALKDRQMKVSRLFLIPIVFLIWGAHSVMSETAPAELGLGAMLIGLLVGVALGYSIWYSQPPLRKSVVAGQVIRAGTPLTLLFIVIAFCVKFILSSFLHIHPALRAEPSFCILFDGMTGLIDGIFWGGTLRLFIPWYLREAQFK